MAKIYRVIQIKSNRLVYENIRMIADLPTKRITVTNIYQNFAYKIAAKIDWRRYGTI